MEHAIPEDAPQGRKSTMRRRQSQDRHGLLAGWTRRERFCHEIHLAAAGASKIACIRAGRTRVRTNAQAIVWLKYISFVLRRRDPNSGTNANHYQVAGVHLLPGDSSQTRSCRLGKVLDWPVGLSGCRMHVCLERHRKFIAIRGTSGRNMLRCRQLFDELSSDAACWMNNAIQSLENGEPMASGTGRRTRHAHIGVDS